VPFLRVLRDKRGYETTYLMHWFREGNKQKSRILYAFRTPPGVKVGRDPISPEIVREIEARHPDIEFDWRALRENQQVIDTSSEPRRTRQARARPEPEVKKQEIAPVAAVPPRLTIPPAIEGTTREDQFVFLLKWYLQLRERVPHRTQDPVRRDALMALVERLNPEAWVGEEQVVAGLQSAAEALQRLSRVFSKRRRKRRAKSAETPETAASDAHVPDTHEPQPHEP
jgi:hypothetical protein